MKNPINRPSWYFATTLAATFLGVCLNACATVAYTPPAPRILPTDPNIIAQGSKKKHDDFKRSTTFEGMDASVSPDRDNSVFLRAWKDDTESGAHYQIYIVDSYGGSQWRFYDAAYDSNGKKLNLISISRDVGECFAEGCNHYEHLALNVDRDYLLSNQETGIKFKISGRIQDEDRVLFLPPAFIKGFLMSVQ